VPEGDRNAWIAIGRYSGLAFILPVSAVVGYIIGYLLDKAFGTHFLYLVFLVLGIVAGFVQLLREAQKISDADRDR
jgi:F0F1-type ATP synthase assembly protein I